MVMLVLQVYDHLPHNKVVLEEQHLINEVFMLIFDDSNEVLEVEMDCELLELQ